MTTETDTAQADAIAAMIEGARRRSADVPPNADTANKFPPMFDVSTITVLAGPVWIDAHISAQFRIRSVRIDNGTNQWLQLGPNGDYVPPFTYGVVFNVRGQGTIEIFRAVPLNSGIVQATPIAGQSYTITTYDKPQNPFQYSSNAAQPRQIAQPIETVKAAAAFGGQTITVPLTGPAWRIDSLALVLTTTAVVGNRFLVIDFKDAAGNLIFTIQSTTAVVASAGRNLWATNGGNPGSTNVFNSMDYLDLPNNLEVPPGGTISFREAPAVDAADTLSVVLMATPVV